MKTRLVGGGAVGDLLAKAAQRSGAYRRVIIYTAFLDALGIRLLERILHKAAGQRMQVDLWLGPSAYKSATGLIRCRSRLVRNLHSKVYALEGCHAAEDDLIVTSANLTRAGLKTNHEMGVRMSGSAPRVRRTIKRVVRLTDNRPKSRKKSNMNGEPFETAISPNTTGVRQ